MTVQKVWFVTGATRGFGRHWIEAALARGDKVAATARDPQALAGLAQQYGDALLVLKVDVTDRTGVFAAVAQAHRHFGKLDVVLSNAGFGYMSAIEEATVEDTRAVFETNVFGTLSLVQAALPLLRAQGRGHIILVSSVAGVVAVPIAGIYEATKFAVEAIGEALAAEVAEFGVKVSLVEPGGYATDFLSSTSVRNAEPIAAYDGVREQLAAMLTPDSLGDPAATAAAILKLVDAEQPPLRLILGNLLPFVQNVYAERLKTWDDWQDVSLAAMRIEPKGDQA
ncbi:SDR family NAD(P)-dependent oxidoreductase [Janthinobacterium sp.]|uniref:SDR family NAD(P)-dependent oxidoreductase n=1 Tax=Janthinobacterium sp. TaxID=1871054 RepID=UPI0026329B69|nr:SDR family NAD(P)-dependent oxidoreductase [Janthinobacterium sp.]